MRNQQPSMAVKSRRGAYAVEFAMVSPVLFLLIFALFEFSRMVMVQQALTNATREGCRTATLATTTTQSAVDDKIRDYLASVISNASDTSQVQVTVTPSTLSGLSPGTEITCAIQVLYSDVSWLPSRILGSSVLRATSTMERE